MDDTPIKDVKKKVTKIHKSRDKKDIPVPKLPFEKFYKQQCFDTIQEMTESKEWKDIYSNYYDFGDLEKGLLIHETPEEIEEYDAHRQMQEIIKCTNSFSYFCLKYAKINHPIFGLINFIPYTYQKRVIDCYGKERFNILSKFRQGGLTTVSVVWALWRCLFKTGQRIMVVSKTDREAIAAGEVAKTAMEYLPSWLKPETDKCNEHEKQFKTTSSVMWFYTVEAARGKAITILIIDEAAFIADMHKHWKALYPVISTGGSCEVISTVNGMGNWYEETYHLAEDGKNPFNIIELDYWEHPLYNDPKWIEDTRATLGESGWQQEIERSFLGSGTTWINPIILTALTEHTRDNIPQHQGFEKWRNHGAERKNEWDEGALWTWKRPEEGHEYIIGVDCAEGVGDSGDNSAFQILDIATLEQVAEFYSNTISPHVYAQLLNEIGYFYNTALIVVENMHPGTAVLMALQHDLSYENLHYDDNKQQSPGLKSSKTKRPQFLEVLQQRLLNGTLRLNSPRLVTELNTFIFNALTKKPEAQRGKHDDAILSMALALYVRDAQQRGLPAGAEIPSEQLQIFKSEVYEEIKREIMMDDMDDFLGKDDADNMFATDLEMGFYRPNPRVKRKFDSLLREFGF